MDNIKLVLLFSGKRKSGKDFICEKLNEKFGPQKSQIIRISEPIKTEWAKKLNLDLNELLSDGPYKEKYRKDMIIWSDQIRTEDYGYFCREAIKNGSKNIIIISDIRRKNDIKYFREIIGNKIKTIRIVCSENERIRRGWKFQSGIDNVQSECDLDDVKEWDLEVLNENRDGESIVDEIIDKLNLKNY